MDSKKNGDKALAEGLIIDVIRDDINENLVSAILSNAIEKENIQKIKIRPVLIRGELLYQSSEFIGTKVFHKNLELNELRKYLHAQLKENFRQAEIVTKTKQINILVSKKGKETVKVKAVQSVCVGKTELEHNRKKKYILEEGSKAPFLVDLGIMTKEGVLIKAKSDKFRQINRFLEYIEDILPYLPKNRELTILDFGCGKSYLTFAIYFYLKELKGYDIRVIGLDLKQDVISKCNELSRNYGYDKLSFLVGDVASYQEVEHIDMMVTLHACDTATDYALYKAVKWNAKVILSVPCCQHEVNKQIDCEKLEPVLKYGLIKERMSALITDALRANLLEQQGYQVQVLEFIDMEHTPKNILIRAVKTSKSNYVKNQELKECMELLRVSPKLHELLK